MISPRIYELIEGVVVTAIGTAILILIPSQVEKMPGMATQMSPSFFPTVAAVLWGTFAVPNDPSRSGKAPVAIPGVLRLILELGFFVFAAWGIFDLGYLGLSGVFGMIVVVHYLVSYDRILWLLKQ